MSDIKQISSPIFMSYPTNLQCSIKDVIISSIMNEHHFSAPGRVEIGGNHTDHQHGRVLTASIDLKIKCTAAANKTDNVRIISEHFGEINTNLNHIDIAHYSDIGTSAALIRGVGAWFVKNNYPIGGFDAKITSSIPAGAGLSSSAAFEVLIGKIFKGLFSSCITPLEIAFAGKFAENVYFGKPCGLMDQIASSFGGLLTIDFANPQNPTVTPLTSEFPGYVMCIINTGGSHADMTAEYSAIQSEMATISNYFGADNLRDVHPDSFYSSLAHLRPLGDRAVLRAIHFFEENERVIHQISALKNNDIQTFLDLINESGRSSLAYLQNVYNPSSPNYQGITLALALSEKILNNKGACRVHGGGFAGTILAFVPVDYKENYRQKMENIFGGNSCYFLDIV